MPDKPTRPRAKAARAAVKPERTGANISSRRRVRSIVPASLSSLGPVSGEWLASVGITTVAELERIGAVEAFGRVRFRVGRAATRNLLYALEAALRDIHWTAITPADKVRLCRAAGIAPPSGHA